MQRFWIVILVIMLGCIQCNCTEVQDLDRFAQGLSVLAQSIKLPPSSGFEQEGDDATPPPPPTSISDSDQDDDDDVPPPPSDSGSDRESDDEDGPPPAPELELGKKKKKKRFTEISDETSDFFKKLTEQHAKKITGTGKVSPTQKPQVPKKSMIGKPEQQAVIVPFLKLDEENQLKEIAKADTKRLEIYRSVVDFQEKEKKYDTTRIQKTRDALVKREQALKKEAAIAVVVESIDKPLKKLAERRQALARAIKKVENEHKKGAVSKGTFTNVQDALDKYIGALKDFAKEHKNMMKHTLYNEALEALRDKANTLGTLEQFNKDLTIVDHLESYIADVEKNTKEQLSKIFA